MSIFSDLGIMESKDRLNEEVLYNLAASYGLVEKRIAGVLEPYNLSPVKMNTLLIIKHVGGSMGLPQIEIGKRMVVTEGNITRLLDRMEKESLLKRSSVEGDRRIKLVKITSKGSGLLDKAWPAYKREVDRMAYLLSSNDLKNASRILEKFRRLLCKLEGGNR